ncbi:hypothetical protein M8J76_009155 [Diaphorina citri]|nr:hypothetical protein M8J75_015065 [Diaphorina citri]KAI5722490.1 hypothetical protein M8J76_009155 [Diaphorina citri]
MTDRRESEDCRFQTFWSEKLAKPTDSAGVEISNPQKRTHRLTFSPRQLTVEQYDGSDLLVTSLQNTVRRPL